MMKHPWPQTAAMILAAAALAACGSPTTSTEAPPAQTAAPAPAAALPAGLFSEAAPEGAVALTAARQSAQPGDQVTVTGKVGGRAAPFVAERALFTLADGSLQFCGDECAVPWDACCVPPDQVAASTATVQVLDEAGSPLRVGLEGQSGLAPAVWVTVEGTVAKGQGEALVINASRIHVAGETPGA